MLIVIRHTSWVCAARAGPRTKSGVFTDRFQKRYFSAHTPCEAPSKRPKRIHMAGVQFREWKGVRGGLPLARRRAM